MVERITCGIGPRSWLSTDASGSEPYAKQAAETVAKINNIAFMSTLSLLR
ncbi:hypothetical protein OKW43_006005 [Paraburkholderia sp. WC7.3g]